MTALTRSGLILKDKVALVVGASMGLGAAIAEEFVACGAKVVLGSRDLAKTQAVADRLAEGGGDVRVVRSDLLDVDSLEEAVNFTVREFGRLDAAVNNGGVGQDGVDFTQLSLDTFDNIIGINLRGVFFAMQHQVRAMLQVGGGSIVNIASAAAIMGVRHKAVYAASKHGLAGLSKSAAIEFADRNIRINTLCPGAFETHMFGTGTGAKPETRNKLVSAIPLGRVGDPRELASAASWLCSDGASYTTGVVMPVDGGVSVP